MRSKEAFAYSRSTGYFCSVATDHPAPCRVTLRRAGACHDATGMDETITLGAIDDGSEPIFWPLSLPSHIAREYLGLEFRITDYDSNPGIGG
jgi:hypothetical protein